MPTLLAVGGRTAPVLLQEHPQPFFGRGKIGFRIERAQWWIGGDSLIKPLNECHEGLMAADRVVEGLQRCLLRHPDHSPSPGFSAGRMRAHRHTSNPSGG